MKFKCGCEIEPGKFSFSNIPLDCKETWKLIASGFTKGIFQIEKNLGKRYSAEIKPNSIEELSDLISLIRPGCLEAEYREKPEKPGSFSSITNTYIKVRNGAWKPEYIHECLEPIFEDTCGVPIYQEQIMRICTDFAGFTLKEADMARKCLHGDSYMWTPDGYFKIRELVGTKRDILTCSGFTNKINKAKRVFVQKKKKRCVKVLFDGGTEIICTPDHNFFTNNGWVQAKNLLSDEHFCIHELSSKYGTEQISDDEIFVIVGLITEGYMPSRNGIAFYRKKSPNTFVNKDKLEIARFKLAIRNLFGIELKQYTNKNGVISVTVPDYIIDKLGISRGLSVDKILPQRMLRLPKDKLFLAIAKLIDFDGWVEERGVFYTTKSMDLAKQVMMLLESIGGVRAYIYEKEVEKYGIFYNIGVSDSRCLDKLRQLIPYSSKINNNTFPIKRSKNLDVCGRNRQLEFFINMNAYWNKVVSVSNAGYQEVFDFTMSSETTPQAYVNSILVHNSIGKKKKDLMKEVEKNFISGALARGHEKEVAETIFGWIDKFSGYSFNKSHGVSYAMIGYRTAYAKRHFPLEFFKAMLANSDGKQDSLEEIQELVHEARLFGISITPPNLSLQNMDFAKQDDNTIAFGLGHIKGVGKGAFASLKRIKDIKSHNEFLTKAFDKGHKVRKDVAEALIKSGALDYLGDNRINLLHNYMIMSILTPREQKWIMERINEIDCKFYVALDGMMDSNVPNKRRKPAINEAVEEIRRNLNGNKKKMAIAYEKHYLGIPLSGSLVELYANEKVNIKCANFPRLREGTKGSMGVVIEKVRKIKDKNKNWMCFLTISDETYMLDCTVVFSSYYNKLGWIIEEGRPVLISGRKNKGSFLVSHIEHL